MPQATITGGNTVTAITVTSNEALATAQSNFDNIASLLNGGFTGTDITTGVTTTAPIVGSIIGNTAVNLGTLNNNVQALTIDNTATTIVGNSRFIGNESVLASGGGLTFTDSGGSTSIVVGGGNNIVNFGTYSTNATFTGDGSNMLNLYTASGATSVFGTSASSDTIMGSANVASSVTYTSSAHATMFINPSAANVTVFGASGAGTTTVFGGSSATPFSGRLTVVDGTGYFQGGLAGNNVIGSSNVGSTTLIGGGGNDVLTSKGMHDVLVAGGGTATLDGSHSVGGNVFFASSTGTSLMYGGDTVGDTFFTNNSTVVGVGYTGSFINLHTGPNSQLRGLNSNVPGTVAVGFSGAGANYTTIGDFISGVDKLVLNVAVTGSNYTLTNGTMTGGGTPLIYTNVQTSNGSLITIYNATVVASDIVKV